MDADDVVPAYFVLADEAAARIRAALRERADGTIRLIQTRRTIRFRFLGKLAALYDFDRTNIYPFDAHLPHYVPLLGGGNSISIAARPTQDSQRSTGSSTASSGWSISASRTSCSADGPWRSSAGCWAQRWLRRCRARVARAVPATGICYAEGLAKGLGKPMVNALEKLHRPNNRTLCFADVERRTGLIRDHLKLTGEDLQGKQVVVVDEAIFTGTDARIVCQMLREGGCGEGAYRDPDADEQLPLRAVCPPRCRRWRTACRRRKCWTISARTASPTFRDSRSWRSQGPPAQSAPTASKPEIEKSVSRAACAGYVFHAVVLWISTKLQKPLRSICF